MGEADCLEIFINVYLEMNAEYKMGKYDKKLVALEMIRAKKKILQ